MSKITDDFYKKLNDPATRKTLEGYSEWFGKFSVSAKAKDFFVDSITVLDELYKELTEARQVKQVNCKFNEEQLMAIRLVVGALADTVKHSNPDEHAFSVQQHINYIIKVIPELGLGGHSTESEPDSDTVPEKELWLVHIDASSSYTNRGHVTTIIKKYIEKFGLRAADDKDKTYKHPTVTTVGYNDVTIICPTCDIAAYLAVEFNKVLLPATIPEWGMVATNDKEAAQLAAQLATRGIYIKDLNAYVYGPVHANCMPLNNSKAFLGECTIYTVPVRKPFIK